MNEGKIFKEMIPRKGNEELYEIENHIQNLIRDAGNLIIQYSKSIGNEDLIDGMASELYSILEHLAISGNKAIKELGYTEKD